MTPAAGGNRGARGASNRYGRTTRLELEAVRAAGGATALARVYATQPFRVMKPFSPADGAGFAQVITMSSSAGLMAGDVQEERVRVGAGAALAVSAQAFEKVHRMEGAGSAARHVALSVEPGGRLLFLQQPVIPFAGSRFAGETRVELADGTAAVAYGEVLCCGRAARGERFQFARFANRVRVDVGGAPLYAENQVLDPAEEDLEGIGFFEGFSHAATLVVAAPWLDDEGFAAARAALSVLTGDEAPAFDDGAPAAGGATRGGGAQVGAEVRSNVSAVPSSVPSSPVGADAALLSPINASACGAPLSSPGAPEALVGGITRIGGGELPAGWVVKLLGSRAQNLQAALARVACIAGFSAPFPTMR